MVLEIKIYSVKMSDGFMPKKILKLKTNFGLNIIYLIVKPRK